MKEWGFSGGVTEDERYLFISVWLGMYLQELIFLQRFNSAKCRNYRTD